MMARERSVSLAPLPPEDIKLQYIYILLSQYVLTSIGVANKFDIRCSIFLPTGEQEDESCIVTLVTGFP